MGKESRRGPGALAAPQALSELPPEVQETILEADRKCGVFIFPQLRQLGAGARVEEIVEAAQALAEAGPSYDPGTLGEAYRALLARAQLALREARTEEAQREGQQQPTEREGAALAAAMQSARAQLPQSRMSRLEQRLEALSDGDQNPLQLVQGAVADWERQSQTRQTREAERLADLAHRVVQPRPQETARSRRARRDQRMIVELARSFRLEEQSEEASEPQ